MDTSKEYILMCEKAVEVQKPHEKFNRGDIYNDFDEGVQMAPPHTVMTIDPPPTWLPRQDQLQKIEGSQWWNGLIKFNRWLNETFTAVHRHDKFTSIEQLWLAFVMKDNFNKTWNGEDWIK